VSDREIGLLLESALLETEPIAPGHLQPYPKRPESAAIHHHARRASSTALGFFAMTTSRTRAGPSGCR
jgi:hypothetical protein